MYDIFLVFLDCTFEGLSFTGVQTNWRISCPLLSAVLFFILSSSCHDCTQKKNVNTYFNCFLELMMKLKRFKNVKIDKLERSLNWFKTLCRPAKYFSSDSWALNPRISGFEGSLVPVAHVFWCLHNLVL